MGCGFLPVDDGFQIDLAFSKYIFLHRYRGSFTSGWKEKASSVGAAENSPYLTGPNLIPTKPSFKAC